MYSLRWYQSEAVDATWNYLCNQPGNPCIVLPTGCHAAGHLILMADGSLRQVETIVPGDKVMGPDGQPRTVLNLCRGRDQMFLISPIRGEQFRVNGNHVLHLECTPEGKHFPSSKKGGEVDHVSVNDYISKSKSWKHLRKLRQAEPITFPCVDRDYKIPPYIVGMMLGDGHMKSQISLTTADDECAKAFMAFADSHGWSVSAWTKKGNRAKLYSIVSDSRGKSCPAKRLFAEVGMLGKTGGDKHIPREYGIAPRSVRLQVLAGLMDSDGHHDGRGGFDFINKSERLCRGVVFIARSLGLRARIAISRKRSQSSSKRIYWRVSISGDTNEIPCRIPRKQAPAREQKKSHLRFGFKVEPCGVDNYYGFTLDGDHLYVDGNFIVHHNSGKSLVIAELTRRSAEVGKKVMCLAHRKELLTQNAEKIVSLLPGVGVGIYSAGLRRRDTDQQVILAGIQSVHKRAFDFGQRHLVIVDESHLVPTEGEGMYRTFFDDLRKANPGLRTVGLTATPFRTGEGKLCGPSRLFQDVCYEAPIQRLIGDGFLSQVINKPADSAVDTSGLHVRCGEFVQHEVDSLFAEGVGPACQEIIAKSVGRQSILIFCSGIPNAEKVADTIAKATGEDVGIVHSGSMPIERSAALSRFKNRQLRWLVNVDVLTTGFDAPCIDCLAILRSTLSAGLFAQMVGRGFRLYEGKQDFLVLDFGGNLDRHGPIDSIDYGKAKTAGGGGGEAPTKQCPNCEEDCLIAARQCDDCGFAFPPPEVPHEDSADEKNQILSEPQNWIVEKIDFCRHRKRTAKPEDPETLRVDYICQPADGEVGDLTEQKISEWVCIEHEGFARDKAERWWGRRSKAVVPDTIDEAIDLWLRGAIAGVSRITTIKDGRWDRITSAEIDEIPEEWPDEAPDDPFELEEAVF